MQLFGCTCFHFVEYIWICLNTRHFYCNLSKHCQIFIVFGENFSQEVGNQNTHARTHTRARLTALCPGLPRWAGTRKVKPVWILLKQETMSGNSISWAICKSAPHSRQITTPAPHHSVFYRPDALPAAQQPTVSRLSSIHRMIWYYWLGEGFAFSALTLLVGRQEGHPACKKTEWWGAGVAICLERSADLHTAQLMPLPLTVSCFSEIQIGFTFLVPAHPGSPGKRAIKWVCVCVCVRGWVKEGHAAC